MMHVGSWALVSHKLAVSKQLAAVSATTVTNMVLYIPAIFEEFLFKISD